MANSFSVARSHEGDISVLSVNGYLDAHTAPQFEKAIQEEYDGGRFRIIVNCAGLTYISSAGLGVFMSFVEDVREASGDIKICSVYRDGIPGVRDSGLSGACSIFCRTSRRPSSGLPKFPRKRIDHGFAGTHISTAGAVSNREPGR